MLKFGIFFLLTLFVTSSTLVPLDVRADAWWGKGYKTPEWVLANGGTIIYVTLQGKKPNNYKGFLRKNGKYVEVEFGKSMLFDDAKNGSYTITFYNCNKDCRYQETDNKTKLRGNDSQKITVPVVARPGARVYITYNTDTNKASVRGGGGYASAPVIKKKTWAEQVTETTLAEKGQYCDLTQDNIIVTGPNANVQELTSQRFTNSQI